MEEEENKGLIKRTLARYIPFGILPSHWGLSGRMREIARLEYTYEPSAVRDIKIAEQELGHNETELKRSKIKILKEYNEISQYSYEAQMAGMIEDETQRQLSILEIEKIHGKIEDDDYSKQRATIKKEPWVGIVKVDFDPNQPNMGSFEFDWNEYFIEELDDKGYVAPKEEEMVELWFNDVCRNVAYDAFSGIGDFDERMEEIENIESYEDGRHVQRVNLGKDKNGNTRWEAS